MTTAPCAVSATTTAERVCGVRVQLQPSWLLHSRPYRDSSLLLDVFTADCGRLGLVARGVRRRSRGGSLGAHLQPFRPLLLSFSGRGELQQLTAVEAPGAALGLAGERLFSGLYLNELLVRLLQRQDPHPELFACYGLTLEALAEAGEVAPHLRAFENQLLDTLGYHLQPDIDASSGETVQADRCYHFDPESGLWPAGVAQPGGAPVYPGHHLLAMARGDYRGAVARSAKGLLRQALAVHLGDRPLRSRELFRARLTGEGRG